MFFYRCRRKQFYNSNGTIRAHTNNQISLEKEEQSWRYHIFWFWNSVKLQEQKHYDFIIHTEPAIQSIRTELRARSESTYIWSTDIWQCQEYIMRLLLKSAFSEAPMGGWEVQKILLAWSYIFGVPKFPLPLKLAVEKLQLGFHQSQKQGQCPEFLFHVAAGCSSASKSVIVC